MNKLGPQTELEKHIYITELRLALVKAQARLESFWHSVYHAFDIEPRAFFEDQAPKTGNWTPEQMALHHIWKRDAVVVALEAKIAALEKRLEDKGHTTIGCVWPNGCQLTVPAALRYLASKPRPSGGNESFNSEHLYQLADEIERAAGINKG